MKIKELISVLSEQDPELLVALRCDHGQETMRLSGYGCGYVWDVEGYVMEEVEPQDGATEVYVLEAM